MDPNSTILAFAAVLARQDDDFNWGKVIGPAIFILIWLIGLAGSVLNKKKKTQETQETWTGDLVEVPRSQTPPPVLPPVPSQQRRGQAPPPLPKAGRQKKQKTQQRRPPTAFEEAQLVEAPSPLEGPRATARSTRGTVATAATVASVRRMLTPKALKQVYVVSELFDKKQ